MESPAYPFNPPQPFATSSGERSNTETRIDIEAAVAVQLVRQTNHLTLSVSSQDDEARGPSLSSCSPTSQSPSRRLITSVALANDAQLYLRVAAGDGTGVYAGRSAVSTGMAAQQATSGKAYGTSAVPMSMETGSSGVEQVTAADADNGLPEKSAVVFGCRRDPAPNLSDLPNEILLHILGYLDVCDLLSTSRTTHHLRDLSVAPILHSLRLRRARASLSPMLQSPSRPSLADLIARCIFLTHTTVVSRRLARSLVCIRLSRRLAARPSAEALVQRCVLPPECVPGGCGGFGPRRGGVGVAAVAPALVARRRAVERERVKDRLRRWVERVWTGEVRERSEGIKKWEERVGVGRVWRLRRFWESVGREDGFAGGV